MPKSVTCENPNCQRVVKQLRGIDLEEGHFRLCNSCYLYAHKRKVLRTADMVKKAETVRSVHKPHGKCCHNSNCRTTDLDNGRYGQDNGEFYCKACAQYRDRRSVDRPKALVERQKRIASNRGFGECENPNCAKMVQHLTRFEFSVQGWKRLCRGCYEYARSRKGLRPADIIKEGERLKKRQDRRSSNRCFNKNCRTTILDCGGYGKHNDEFYCYKCALYVNYHGGVERPKSLVDASPTCLYECENPDCDSKTACPSNTYIDGQGTLKLCQACYSYAKKTAHLRTPDMVEKSKKRKLRRTTGVQCHNENCRATDFSTGGFAKYNREYYCSACCQYIDEHNGTERPKKLVDEANLRHSRWMWQLHHPDLSKV